MASISDLTTMAVGAVGWAAAIPAVKMAGAGVAAGGAGEKSLALVIGVGIAAATTPLLSYLLQWQTPHERVRGVALALGAAQVTDGLFHLFWPAFYAVDAHVGLACAGNIFYGAGLLGIFSAYM
jgi:hypothetical protein